MLIVWNCCINSNVRWCAVMMRIWKINNLLFTHFFQLNFYNILIHINGINWKMEEFFLHILLFYQFLSKFDFYFVTIKCKNIHNNAHTNTHTHIEETNVLTKSIKYISHLNFQSIIYLYHFKFSFELFVYNYSAGVADASRCWLAGAEELRLGWRMCLCCFMEFYWYLNSKQIELMRLYIEFSFNYIFAIKLMVMHFIYFSVIRKALEA